MKPLCCTPSVGRTVKKHKQKIVWKKSIIFKYICDMASHIITSVTLIHQTNEFNGLHYIKDIINYLRFFEIVF